MNIPQAIVAVAAAPYSKRNVLRQTLAAIKDLKANVLQFHIWHSLTLLWFKMQLKKETIQKA